MVTLLVSAAVTAASAPGIRKVLTRWGLLDLPNHRSSHARPTPRGGGIACLMGLGAGAIVASLMTGGVNRGVMLASVALCAIGLVDDRRPLGAKTRLSCQVGIGVALGALQGDPWAILVGAVVVPAIVNVVNFMDGINGITGMVMALWGLTALLSGVAPTAGALTCGIALGFLPANVGRAYLFLGDSGSYLFGGLVAGVLLTHWKGTGASMLLVAPMLIYFVDTSWTLQARWRRGASLLEAHREHVYQKLVHQTELPHWAAAVLVTVLSAAIVTSWWFNAWLGISATVLVLSCYLLAPKILRRDGLLMRPVRALEGLRA